jgi:hypothetical protein
MKTPFDIKKFVKYLDQYKSELPNLYKWHINNLKIDRLVQLEVLSLNDADEMRRNDDFQKAIKLKRIISENLSKVRRTDNSLFEKICLWIIKDWGGINTADDTNTLLLINDFLSQGKISFNRIASLSKLASFMYPTKNVIYDSRITYSVNWIILSESAGEKFFPIPEGRNTKMNAFDLDVLIRLKNINNYLPQELKDLDNKHTITNADKKIFILKEDSYEEMNKLIKEINRILWSGDMEKENNLYYTEMLLFAIADREIFRDITINYKNILLK